MLKLIFFKADIYFRTKELCKGNLLVLIITLYLKKRVLKEYTRKPIYWVGEEWCSNIFQFSYIFNTKMTILAKK